MYVYTFANCSLRVATTARKPACSPLSAPVMRAGSAFWYYAHIYAHIYIGIIYMT